MKVLFVGTGLIGGSFSLAMQEKGLLTEAGGYSRRPTTLQRAVERGLITRKFEQLEAGIAWADWIILSIPVDAICKALPSIMDQVKDHQLVIDFGSTKASICASVADHPMRHRFLAAHPIAGTEHSGPEAAFSSLFQDKLMILCEEEKTLSNAVAAFRQVCQKLGIQMESMTAAAHDRHLAYISHLSHVTSFALSNTVLTKEKGGSVILELAGSGFASTVRLAKSSPEMWAPIFMENKEMVLEALDLFINQVDQFRQLLRKDDVEGIRIFLEAGREIRKVIK